MMPHKRMAPIDHKFGVQNPKEARRRLGITQIEMAAHLSDLGFPCSKDTYSRWERGFPHQKSPFSLVRLIAIKLGISPEAICGLADYDYYIDPELGDVAE